MLVRQSMRLKSRQGTYRRQGPSDRTTQTVSNQSEMQASLTDQDKRAPMQVDLSLPCKGLYHGTGRLLSQHQYIVSVLAVLLLPSSMMWSQSHSSTCQSDILQQCCGWDTTSIASSANTWSVRDLMAVQEWIGLEYGP